MKASKLYICLYIYILGGARYSVGLFPQYKDKVFSYLLLGVVKS